MIAATRRIREALRPTDARPFPVVIVKHGYRGRFGFTLQITNVRDRYGSIGSQGYTLALTFWRDEARPS